MAPELALAGLRKLPKGSVILDPMSGSGTVLRQASELGHCAIGFDTDPLAVLMSRVWTRPVQDSEIEALCNDVMREASSSEAASVKLAWLEGDWETARFVEYWFGPEQRRDLRSLAAALHRREVGAERPEVLDVLRLALSRIIITKENGASLARDVSHSRPHKVCESSDYSVFEGFVRSVRILRKRLLAAPSRGGVSVSLGDARAINLEAGSVDTVLTSPPYLNAIDYMRGHRLALVWLGHRLAELRQIRSNSIGAERGPDEQDHTVETIRSAMGEIEKLPRRHQRMIDRYVGDLRQMVGETARVLKPGGLATYVVGNSCLKGVFINNANAVARSASLAGMTLVNRSMRDLPDQSRYLPISGSAALGKRMRTEAVLTFTV